jgi:hypothetical protein
MNHLIIGTVLLTWCASALAGCATTGKNVSLQVEPITTQVASSKTIYLTINSDNEEGSNYTKRSLSAQKSHVLPTAPQKILAALPRITLVNVNNDEGETVGISVMPAYSGDLIVIGLRKGLTAAGYTVISVRKQPDKAARGIDISWISTEMEQNSGLMTLAGKCRLHIRLDLWRNGTKSVSHEYATMASDYSITDQNALLAKLMKKAIQDITAQAVPTIISDISASAQ